MTVVTSIKNTVPSVSSGRLPTWAQHRPITHRQQVVEVPPENSDGWGKHLCRCLVIWSALALICSLIVGFVYGISALSYILPHGNSNTTAQREFKLALSTNELSAGIYSVPKTEFCFKWCGQAFYYRYRCSDSFTCPVTLPAIQFLDNFNICYVVCGPVKPVVAVNCENLLTTCEQQ